MSTELSLQTQAFIADTFVDVAGLNAHVSSALEARIEEVSESARRGKRVTAKAFAILGAAGGGKTHIFARLRHDAGLEATLILLRPFFGVSLAPRDVLATMIDQLCLPVRGGTLTRLDLLALHWLRDEDAREAESFPSAALEALQALSSGERASRVDRAVADVLAQLPEAAPAAHLVRALLSLASGATDAREPAARWAELAWLSGREARPQPQESPLPSSPLSEADVAHVMRIVAVIAAPVAPLVLTFDQLENLAGDDDARVLGYGNLIAELIDTIPSLTIAQLALTSEWMQYIEPRLTLPQKTRVQGEVLLLEAPDRSHRELLLRAWHTHLAPSNGRGGRKRFPSPLTAEELESLLVSPGMTPRLLLQALSRAASGKPAVAAVDVSSAPRSSSVPPPSLRSADRFEAAWRDEQESTMRELAQKTEAGLAVDATELAEAVTVALSFVPALVVGNRHERDRILTDVRSPAGACTLLYATGTHHASVGSALARAIELAQNGKAIFVREKHLTLPSTWEAVHERRASFECLPNARWLSLETEEVALMVTLARLMSRARASRLRAGGSEELITESQLRAFVAEQRSPVEWRVTVAIVSWLSDVPRERAKANSLPPPPPAPARAEVPSSSTPPTLGQWVRLGAEVGRATVSRYAEKLRALRGTRREK